LFEFCGNRITARVSIDARRPNSFLLPRPVGDAPLDFHVRQIPNEKLKNKTATDWLELPEFVESHYCAAQNRCAAAELIFLLPRPLGDAPFDFSGEANSQQNTAKQNSN
jgi:hypothetical protein